ncbi:MAG: hypothetical protein K9W44_05515 [Candidatus Lokiarchaeota archaeon]|nr:hypothetical protein [Candidatus Harpocratesius repetitus]
MAENNDILQQISNQINQITQNLDGTIAQIEALNRRIEQNSKNITESLTNVNENMRLIIEVIKKGRANTQEDLEKIHTQVANEIQKLWDEKSLESITKEELDAIEKLKDINKSVGENLYMSQLLTIIQSLQDITSRALTVKAQKSK